jgi:hypothetical protein
LETISRHLKQQSFPSEELLESPIIEYSTTSNIYNRYCLNNRYYSSFQSMGLNDYNFYLFYLDRMNAENAISNLPQQTSTIDVEVIEDFNKVHELVHSSVYDKTKGYARLWGHKFFSWKEPKTNHVSDWLEIFKYCILVLGIIGSLKTLVDYCPSLPAFLECLTLLHFPARLELTMDRVARQAWQLVLAHMTQVIFLFRVSCLPFILVCFSRPMFYFSRYFTI